MQNKSKKVLWRLGFLSLLVGLWNVVFVVGQSSQSFFGTSFKADWFSGLVPFSGLVLLLISLQLFRVLKSENPGTVVKAKKESLGDRVVAYAIILGFGAFVLWFLWVKVFLTIMK